jgi:hypothetical protein
MDGVTDTTPPEPGFFFSSSLGVPIPLDCCPPIFIEQELRSMFAYLEWRTGHSFQDLEPKRDEA